MNLDNTFNMKSGMFTTCSGYWDNKTHSFHPADSTNVAACCARNCGNSVKYCQKFCYDNSGEGQMFHDPGMLSRCLDTCNDQRNACLDTCRLSSPYVGTRNNYIECAKGQGCIGTGPLALPTPECVGKNKDAIMTCCRKTCTPHKDLDCQKHCDFLQETSINPDKMGVPRVTKQTLREISGELRTHPDNTWAYVLGAVILSFILITGWLLLHRKK